ncbi:MAG TPA: WYL domain-containing protein [Clostridiales bacterium]|nr:WYL domain-containing protein [Clostridiales bacterium]HQP70403.1 WYL domain-containing protein [Clostridiales bacterium]
MREKSKIERIVYIDRTIKQKGSITKKQIMDWSGACESSVKNDIDFLKNELNAPIYYSGKKKGYAYKEDVPFELLTFLSENMVILYALLKEFFSNRNFMPVITDKILKGLKDELPSEYKNIDGKISFRLSEAENPEMDKFEIIFNSILNETCLEIHYSDAKGVSSERSIEPLHIYHYQGKWSVFSYCKKARDYRVFNLSRITKLETTSNKFRIANHPQNVIENHLNEAFGVARGKEIEQAVIWFYEPTSHHVTDQKWHPDQITDHITRKGKNILQFTLPVAKYEELVGRVLRYAPDAEVRSPIDMRNMWLDKIKSLSEKYLKK